MKRSKVNYWFFALILIGFHWGLLNNLKFTAWPEMLGWPYMILNGFLPYRDIAIAHTPHLVFDLTLFYKIFGVGINQLKIFTWVLILATDVLIWLVASKIWNFKTALYSLAAYIFWQTFFDGNGLWFDSMVTLITVLLFFIIYQKKYFWAGVIWGLMFFTKQTAFWFLVPVFFAIWQSEDKTLNLKTFFGGILLGFAPFLLTMYLTGFIKDFYFWAINFGIFILPRAQGQIQMPGIKNLIISVYPFLIFALPVFFIKKNKNLNLILWAASGAVSAYPRFEYFHFQPAIPFLAFSIGGVISTLFTKNIHSNKKPKKTYTKLIFGFYLIGALYFFAGFFIRNFQEGIRFYEQDVKDVASYVTKHTKSGDRIFVMNWWDNVYALTNRLPATDPFVPQLSWYQNLSGIQEKEVESLQINKPKLVLIQPYTETGLSSFKPRLVYNFISQNYIYKETIDGVEIMIPKK